MDARPVDCEPIYGHELLRILADRGGSAPVAELRAAAAEKFGPDAVFANCGGNQFTFDGVLEFLESRGKLASHGDHVSLGPVPGCSDH